MNFDELKKLCRLSRIKWSKHALERMQERNISRDDVKNCIMHGEIIENYPDDYIAYTFGEKNGENVTSFILKVPDAYDCV